MRVLHRGAGKSAGSQEIPCINTDTSSDDSNFDLSGQIVQVHQPDNPNGGNTDSLANGQVIPEALPSLSTLLNTQGAGVGANAHANAHAFELGLDRGWKVPTLDRVQASTANAEATARPQMDFQLLDDAFVQWPWEEPFYALPWSEDVAKNMTAKNADPDNGEYQSSGLFLGLIPSEIEQAKVNLQLFDVENRLCDFVFPTNYMVIRLVRGFFKHFAPHCPIVHPQTFSIGTIQAPLLLAVMACGAVYLNEQEVSIRLYYAVLKLLSEVCRESSPAFDFEERHDPRSNLAVLQNEDLVIAGQRDSGFQLWELQTRLLTCQYGLFGGDSRIQRQARLSFTRLHVLCREASVEATKVSVNDWAGWVFRESMIRCVSWTTVLRAVLLCNEDNAVLRSSNTEFDGMLPCSEELWSAGGLSWQNSPRVTTTPTVVCFRQLLSGAPLDDTMISPFGLLTLISVILSHICTLRLGNIETTTPTCPDEESLRLALHTWEEAWRTHPHATTVPDAPQGPLMADALVVLNAAYYRLYANVQMNEMKAIARLPIDQVSRSRVAKLYQLDNAPDLMKAIVRACRCLLVRVRLGLGYLLKTSCLNYPCYAPLAAYEGSLLMCWYLLGRHLSEIPGPEDHVITAMMDEIVAESEYKYEQPIQRELLPIMIYRDMIRERWVWPATCNVLSNNLDGMIKRLKPLLEGQRQ
ncbi:uncharacterized protein Z520_09402 [Fonsecaea multimorphosa CBS 102226]|uniref:Xylanolytic transcriptional activator regulatory domain-containing protein n=1 Tax=Fonsecaea multimorphosa CBS 102226 TaxID=1442371 RepID=A0A0D2JMZ6_9EURO|nr:uncharacterized protein Z520_09402 [Fonsecaea multimorphosa CBS 102226]KIX94712.1 hypothetical protein Z520_09402 [Fonsecaea multimorphosa CBS 102226]OAL20487.1 hypothetical protein AYO22_08788 [Fonsecaea multimorphosa]